MKLIASAACILLGTTMFESGFDARVEEEATALRALPAAPARDCYFGGPYTDNAPGGPMIFDQGSAGNTLGAGCDGCAVLTSLFQVTWPAGGGATISGLGTGMSYDIVAGTTSTVFVSHTASGGAGSHPLRRGRHRMDGNPGWHQFLTHVLLHGLSLRHSWAPPALCV